MQRNTGPWKNDSELALVRDWFFPNHAKVDAYSAPPADMRRRAIEKVNVWVFKAGRIPHSVVATALLTDALLHDEAKQRQRESISNTAMRSIYAMAFARFVNGFVDRDVVKSATALLPVEQDAVENNSGTAKGEISMYSHAVTIGMPEVFVDLRHQVTHGEMPSLVYQKKMTLQALEWLWEKWWNKHAKGDPQHARTEIEERKAASVRRKQIQIETLEAGGEAETLLDDARKKRTLEDDDGDEGPPNKRL